MIKIELLIQARWLITVDAANRVLTNHALAVQDGKILDILPCEQAEQSYQPQHIINLPHQAVLPGFINAHTHTPMALLKGLADDLPLMAWLQGHIWPAEARFANADFVYDGSRLAIAEMIRSGTTCFNDMYFFAASTLQAVRESGIRAGLGMIMLDFPSAYGSGPDDYLQKGLELHAATVGHPLTTTLLAPHAPYTVSDESLLLMREQAAALGLPMHMHVHETAGEVIQAEEQNGERPLARLHRLGLLDQHFLAVHMTQLTDDEISLLADKRVHVLHCPESNLKLASGFCPVAKLLAAGVNVALGTDGNASNNDLDMLGEMRTAALIGKAMAGDASVIPAAQALRMATINGARALGLDQVTGSLEPGKAADIISIDLSGIESQPLYDPVSHLVYCTSRNQVMNVWVAGQRLMEERKLLTLNETGLLEKAKTWQARIGEHP